MTHRPLSVLGSLFFVSGADFVLAVSLALGSTGSAPAQSVLTVGSTGEYATLAQAELAAVEGDLILVLPGTFAGMTTGKGVTVAGLVASATTIAGTSQAPLLDVTNLAAGTRFAACNLTFASGPNLSSIRLTNNQGSVHLERLAANLATTVQLTFGVHANACEHVTIANCTLQGGVAVAAVSSRVAISNCNLKGGDAQAAPPLIPPGAAVLADGGSVEIATSSLYGGNGSQGPIFLYPPEPAVRNVGATTLFLCSGNAASVYVAGAAAGGIGASAIDAPFGIITIDPRIGLFPTGGAPPINTNNPVVQTRYPTVMATGVSIGFTLSASLEGVPFDGSQLVIGFPGPVSTTPVGNLWMDPASMFIVDSVVLGASGVRTTSFQVPIIAALWGQPMVLQHLSGLGLIWRLSTPSTVVLF